MCDLILKTKYCDISCCNPVFNYLLKTSRNAKRENGGWLSF